ncbi:MAG TPA: 16S rRNA (cytosine(967)-C(5))-methyltransferase RsmB [Oleiagrimonas sp.]|nr:16S rRNA (cytosine(967)-C(5))-methyltransferase RsmB [Oleiagrimonas sp.]
MQPAPAKTFNVRALAAEALAEVTLQGASLREVLTGSAPRLADPRDRAMLSALLHEGARWWLRYDAALGLLMERSIRRRQPAIHALMVIGLVQIEVLKFPSYAAVGATVDAVRTLKRPRLAPMVNAVLRRWLRERDELIAELDADPITHHALPGWLVRAISEDWPNQAESVFAANNIEPPLTIRVNRRRSQRETLATAFANAGYGSEPHAWLPDALMLERSTDITRLPGFNDGLFAVQDGAAQASAELLEAANGQRILDACSAPGGKACHLLERADVQLTALEPSGQRSRRIHENLHRLGLAAEVVQGDATTPDAWWDGTPFDRILVDAPCSATGVIRRRADVRLHRRAGDIRAMVAKQKHILKALWPLLAPGGRLLYVTCSLLRAENEAVINHFLATHKSASAAKIKLPTGHAAGPGWQILPGEDEIDGMFYAAIKKPR